MILGNFRARGIGHQHHGVFPGKFNPGKMFGIAMLMLVLSACEQNEEAVGSTQGTGGTPPPGATPPPPPGTPPPPPSEPPPSLSDQAIFEATLHPKLIDVANSCNGCHGSTQDPLISVADATIAYNVITSQQKVNLSNPALSRIYLRPKDDRHNCGGDTECDRMAGEFLAAIQDWAMQATAAAPPPGSNGTPVLSAAASFADATAGAVARVDDAAIARFEFAEGAGDVTMDTSGVGTPIALQLQGTEWLPGGGIRMVNATDKAQASEADSRKLFDMITPENAYTVEAWVTSASLDQNGPARILSYSQDTGTRNFSMNQQAIYYYYRNRTAATNANGEPGLEAGDTPVVLALTHVTMTFDGTVGRSIYINGQLAIEENVADETLDWVDTYALVVGNEVTDDRIWLGDIHFVAIHNRALNGTEILQNFDAGSGEVLTMHFDVSNMVGEPAFVDMRVAEIDSSGYLFAEPTFVSAATGVAVKNIRIGVNGSIPVAAQPFRRVDAVVLQSGEQLSPLGGVIPQELGVDSDRFHLEFEVLGTQQGLAEMAVPSSPPLPVPDVIEPEFGLRTFAQLNDAMSDITGVDTNQNAVLATYSEVRDSLPATHDLLAFSASQQIAVQRLALSYCGVVVQNTASCDALFGNCAVDVNAKDQVASALYNQMIGNNIADQPDLADVTTEIVRMIDDLGCQNGCNGAEGETVLQATCAAVLSSAAITVN